MDSTTVVINSASEALNYLLPQAMIFIVIPLMMWIKKLSISDKLPLELISLILCLSASFGLGLSFAPELGAMAYIKAGLEALGTTTAAYGGYRWFSGDYKSKLK